MSKIKEYYDGIKSPDKTPIGLGVAVAVKTGAKTSNNLTLEDVKELIEKIKEAGLDDTFPDDFYIDVSEFLTELEKLKL